MLVIFGQTVNPPAKKKTKRPFMSKTASGQPGEHFLASCRAISVFLVKLLMPQKKCSCNFSVFFFFFFAHEACWIIVSGRHVHAMKFFRQNRAPSQMFPSRQDELVSFISPRLHFQVVRGFRRQTFGATIFFFFFFFCLLSFRAPAAAKWPPLKHLYAGVHEIPQPGTPEI